MYRPRVDPQERMRDSPFSGPRGGRRNPPTVVPPPTSSTPPPASSTPPPPSPPVPPPTGASIQQILDYINDVSTYQTAMEQSWQQMKGQRDQARADRDTYRGQLQTVNVSGFQVQLTNLIGRMQTFSNQMSADLAS